MQEKFKEEEKKRKLKLEKEKPKEKERRKKSFLVENGGVLTIRWERRKGKK